MNVPPVQKCCGMFPPKHATYLISLIGVAIGGATLAGIILYGVVEKALINFFSGPHAQKMDEDVKKILLVTLGITSLLLTVASVLICLGSTANSRSMIGIGVWVIFVMCMILIGLILFAPLSCFFLKTICVVKKISTTTVFFAEIGIAIFLMFWLYYMVVVYNAVNEG